MKGPRHAGDPFFETFVGLWEARKTAPGNDLLSLLDPAVPEIIRWQSPVALMRRTAAWATGWPRCS